MAGRGETVRVKRRAEQIGQVLLQRVVLLVRRTRLLVVLAVARAQHACRG